MEQNYQFFCEKFILKHFFHRQAHFHHVPTVKCELNSVNSVDG